MMTKALIDISSLGLPVQKIEVWFSPTNIHIKKSWLIKSSYIPQCIDIIHVYASKLGYLYKRTKKSWIKEWRAHNLLFNLDYEVARTKDVDLNENESKLHLFGYNILSFIYALLEA